MKRIFRLFTATVVLPVGIFVFSNAYAVETKYGAAGCGLGSMLLGDTPGPIQILVATLNGIAGNQTFGISSGTLNCEKKANFAGKERLEPFVQSNIDSLAKDIAIGRGESLDALAELMEVPHKERGVVYAKLHANFSNIFPSEQVEAADVIDHIMVVMNQ